MISVVLPVFNAGGYLPVAVASILEQSVSELELIVIDDGSTDGAVDRMREIDDARLTFLETDRLGHIGARAFGIERAEFDRIALMDHDDVCVPERLEQQLEVLADERVSLVGSLYGRMTPRGYLLDPAISFDTEERTAADFTRGQKRWCDPAAVFRKRDILRVGLTDEAFGQDVMPTFWWYRLLELGRCVVIGRPLYYHRVRPTPRSRRWSEVVRAWEQREATAYAAVREKYDPDTWAQIGSPADAWSYRAHRRKAMTQAIESYIAAGDLESAREAALRYLAAAPLEQRAWILAVKAALGRPRLRGPAGPVHGFRPAGRWIGGPEPIDVSRARPRDRAP